MTAIFTNFWFLLFAMIVIPSVVATIARAWQKVRRAEQEAALKQDMLQRGLSVEEIERVLRASAQPPSDNAKESDEHVLEEMAGILGGCQASPRGIEEILAMVQAADSASKSAILRAVQGLRDGSEEDIKEDQIRAVIRGLAHPTGQPGESALPRNDSPALAGAASRFSDAIRASDRPGV